MASLDATHDDMIDILIGHANSMPMTPEQISRHSQVAAHNTATTAHNQPNPHYSTHLHSHHPMDHGLHNQSSSSSHLDSHQHQMSSHFRSQDQLISSARQRDRNNPLDHPHPSLRHDSSPHHRPHHSSHNQVSQHGHHHGLSSRNESSPHDLSHASSHNRSSPHHLSSRSDSSPHDLSHASSHNQSSPHHLSSRNNSSPHDLSHASSHNQSSPHHLSSLNESSPHDLSHASSHNQTSPHHLSSRNESSPHDLSRASSHNQTSPHHLSSRNESSPHDLSHASSHNQTSPHLSSRNESSPHDLSRASSHNQTSTHHLSSHHQSIPHDRAHHNSRNQGSYHHSQNQVDPHLHSQNHVRNSDLNLQSEIVTPQNEATSESQLDSHAQYPTQNQLASQTHLDSHRQQTSTTQSPVTSESQMTSQSQVTTQVTTQSQVTSKDQPTTRVSSQIPVISERQVTSESQETSEQNQVISQPNQSTSDQSKTMSLENQVSSQQRQPTSQDQVTSQQDQVTSKQDQVTSPSSLTQQPEVEKCHVDNTQNGSKQSPNRYLCPGCRKSILYTNRTSLVKLLSLHQQKCSGTQEFRYMCLDCHSAFKTVIQLMQHENICKPDLHNGSDTTDQDANLDSSTSTDEVIQTISEPQEDSGGKPQNGARNEMGEESIEADEELENESLDYGEGNVPVRESWTQTYQQYIKEEEEEKYVEILMDEISPAGRKRRTCARKMKVYNEKQLADQRETADLELIKNMAGKRSAKACKKDLKRFHKVRKMTRKGVTVEVEPNPKVAAPPPEKVVKKGKIKPEKIPKVRKKAEPKEPDLEIPLQCQLCPKTFNRYSVYTKHYQLHHESAMCQYCGVQCIRKKLKQHERSHEKNFKCPYPGCPRVLNSKHRLKRHSRVHTGEKPFLCEICSKPFAGKENMIKHKKRVHDKERKYQCRYCGQKFADKGGLKYHENTHTKIRPTDYRCKYCGRGYKSHVGCYLHERTHTGNMYKCGYCGKEFMAKVHLRKHEYIHTGNYPFRCEGCQKGFPNNGMMKKHKCLAVL